MGKEIIKDCKHHGIVAHVIDSKNRELCKKCRSEAVSKSRRKRKEKLVKYRGGGCELCGYDKCISALEFHHINPEEKEFGLSVRGLTRSWDIMLKECMKCILMCSNCHRELHSGIAKIPKTYEPTIDTSITLQTQASKSRPVVKKKTDICQSCDMEYIPRSNHQKYCCMKCSSTANMRTNRPSKKELKDLIETTPYTKIGKMFNVSDNTIRKWAKSYKLIK